MAIYIPKREIITAHADTNLGVSARWKAVLMDANGKTVYETDWKKNLITDGGLYNMGLSNGTYAQNGCIGTGTTPPAVSDTDLDTRTAYSDSRTIVQQTQDTADPWGVSTMQKFRYSAGTGTGTINEAGTCRFTDGISLFSRWLVSPAIVKNADQVLDIYWEITIYRQRVDVLNTNIDIAEDGGSVLYNTTTRGCQYNTVEPGTCLSQRGIWQTSYKAVYNGTLGTILQTPGVNSTQSDNLTLGGVTYGTLTGISRGAYRDQFLRITLDDGNIADGIKSFKFRQNWNSDIQVQFDDVATGGTRLIPKDNTKELNLSFRETWSIT